MTQRFFPEALYEAGFTDLISVIPPGAQLVPSSTIPANACGKIPGIRTSNSLWCGYSWRKQEHTIDDVRRWCLDGASTGLRADRFPCLDLDITDERIADIVETFALAHLGLAPVRVGRAPKRLLMFRTDEPFGRMRLWIKRASGEQHLVEILGQGQQYLVHGIHPGTGRPYEWLQDPTELGAAGLTPITREQASAWLDALSEHLSAIPGLVMEREGDGRPITRTPAADQAGLLAPSIEALREAMELIPNTDATFPARSDYIRMGYAIRAAAGMEHEEDGFELFAAWAAKWDGGVNDPETVRSDWRRFNGKKSVGWSWIAEQARAYGFNDAQYEFEADPAATPERPPEHVERFDQFNARYAIVCGVANAILSTPDVGTVDFIPAAHWRQLVANEKVRVPKADGGTKLIPLSQYWLQHEQRRTLQAVVFDPSRPALAAVPAEHGGQNFNMWPGFAIAPSPEGSCDRILAYVRDVVCNGDPAVHQWVMQWLADMVQHPAVLPGTALVLRGAPGAGKTTLGQIMGGIMGPRLYTMVSHPSELTARFNSQLQGRMLIQIEEGFWAGDRGSVGKLKHLVTSPVIRIEKKGLEPYDIAHCARLLFTSNEQWVVPAARDERRYTVLDVSSAHMHEAAYFNPLYAEINNGGMARFHHYLLHEVVVDGRIKSPLATAALLDQQTLSLQPDQQWLWECLEEGALPGDEKGDGTADATTLYRQFEQYVRGRGEARRCSPAGLTKLLEHQVGARRTRLRMHGSRRYLYIFPPLPECRERFAAGLNMPLNWEEPDVWQAECFAVAA